MDMKIPLGAMLVLALAAAGCTGNGDDGFETPPLRDGVYVIEMSGVAFSPAKAVVPRDATVAWVNVDGAHNAVPDGHSAWQAKPVQSSPGEHLRVTFQDAGEYPFYCEPHRSIGMKGVLKVE